MENVGSGQLVKEATGSEMISDGVAAALSNTWFVIPNGTHIMDPLTGSRPGDPAADILFSLVLTQIILESSRKELKARESI